MTNAERARTIERYEKWGKECVRLGIVGEAVKDTHFLAFEAGYKESQRELLDKVMPVLEGCYNYARAKDEMNSHWHNSPVSEREMTVRLRELLSELKKDRG